jgi:hypothetical protein
MGEAFPDNKIASLLGQHSLKSRLTKHPSNKVQDAPDIHCSCVLPICFNRGAPMTSVDIFIRTYYKDLGWLSYCLKAIEKHAHGFRDVIVVTPASSAARLVWSGLRPSVTMRICEDFADDYLGQQVSKLRADLYSDADFICHLDSDCILRRPVTPADLIIEGKAIIAMTAYDMLPNDTGWRRLSEQFLRRPVAFDFMRRPPFVYPRWLYGAIREYAFRVHGTHLAEHILAQPPHGFSEFNAMGALAHYHYYDRFNWLRLERRERDETHCRWFWSWGGLSTADAQEIEAILAAE